MYSNKTGAIIFVGRKEIKCDALRDLVSIVQFKKREKHPWRSVIFNLKVKLLLGCFSRFLNCTNCTKTTQIILKSFAPLSAMGVTFV